MKIVFVNGSPRPDGNTGTMLKTLAKEARQRGAEVTYYEILGKDVQDCDGCYRCESEARCVKDDDMTEAYELIRSCDAFVIGSPIYMGAETGMTKCFVDRLYCMIAQKKLRPGKKAAALFTCGMIEGHIFYYYMQTRYDKLLRDDLGFENVMSSIVSGMKTKVDVEGSFYAQKTLKEMAQFLFPEG